MTRAQPDSFLKPKLLALSVAACFALNASPARANPSGPTVAHGSVGFNGLGTSALTITNQAGGNAIINWNGFSIGINELTKFQQFANLAVLNRVTSGQVSSILGALQSDGRVFLINPNGIVFGASARIDVAGMVASSLNLSDQDFLTNRLRFTEVPGAGAVVNNGVIETATGGRVYLVAPTVENNGLIQAKGGEILLAAGKEVELVDGAAPFVTVKITAGSESALNVGNLVAEGGRIGMFGALVRNSGTVEAGGAMVGPGGEIRLVATKDLTLDAGSLVAANGTSGGKVLLQAEGGTNLVGGTVEAKGSSGKGGEVSALGVRVGVVGHGLIDASGETGGGTVLVGGDYQGKNGAVQNAERTYIGTDGVIRADAMTTGDGGRVIVWADGDTRFFGSISARGGSESGNGGFVETSGKQVLQAFGNVNTAAANGQGGTWLLDPRNINIVANNSGPDDAVVALGGIFDYFEGAPQPLTSTIGVNSINAGVLAGGSVELQATEDITLQADVNVTNSGALTLRAGNNIDLGSSSISLTGDLILAAADSGAPTGFGGSVNGAITSTPGFGNIVTNGGFLEASGASVTLGSINTVATMDPFNGSYGGGYVNLLASSGNISTGSIVTDGGNLWASAVYGAISINGSINTSNMSGNEFGSINGGVSLGAYGDIAAGPITTRSLHPFYGRGGNVSLVTSNGVIVVNGDIDARGANGSSQPIDTCQDGCLDFYYGGSQGGSVGFFRSSASLPAGGIAVQVNGSIFASGGDGLSGVADIFGNNNLSGGSGGSVVIGGFGGLRDEQALVKGDAIQIGAPPLTGDIHVAGIIDVSGGSGGSTDVPTASVNGGSGGLVAMSSYGNISSGPIFARGGRGGDGAEGLSYSNYGGDGGGVVILAGGSATLGGIDVSGGAGGNSGAGAYGSAYGGDGGWGGGVLLHSLGEIQVNVGGTLGATAIDASGGAGGAGNAAASPAGNGGIGGNGGTVDIIASPNMTLFGSVLAGGGDGGAGGAGGGGFTGGIGGTGGNGGSIYLDASSVTNSKIGDGTIFVLASTTFDVEGGFGGAAGADGGTAGLAGTTLQTSFEQNLDYFGTIVILDPLSVPGINEGFQQIVEGADDSTAFFGGEKEDEEEDKSQKELSSCKG